MADLLTNMDLGPGRTKCHSALDFVLTPSGDLAVTPSDQVAFQQRLVFWAATPKGENPASPETGCVLHDFMHELNTDSNIRRLELYLLKDIKEQFPELQAKSVRATRSKSDNGEVLIDIRLSEGAMELLFAPGEMLDISSQLAEAFFARD